MNKLTTNETTRNNYGNDFYGNVNGSFEDSLTNLNQSSGASASRCVYNQLDKEVDYFCFGVNGLSYSSAEYGAQTPSDKYVEAKQKDIHYVVLNNTNAHEFYVGGATTDNLRLTINSTAVMTPYLLIDNGTGNNTLTMRASTGDAPTPPTGYATMSVKSQAGRNMFRAIGPSGVDYNFQPSMYQQQIYMILPGTTSSVTQFGEGTAVVTAGTISHPTVDATFGKRFQITTAKANWSNASTSSGNTAWLRGSNSTNTAGASGWYSYHRIILENITSTYTGPIGNSSIIFVGLTSGTLISMLVNSTNLPAGSYAGFYYSNNTALTASNNWTFITGNGTVPSGIKVYNTTLPFSGKTVLDMYQYCRAGCTSIGFRIGDQISGAYYDSTTAVSALELPTNATLLRTGFGVADNSRFQVPSISAQKVYVETDR
jgi:hypothetical protein